MLKAAKIVGGAFIFGMSYAIMYAGCVLIASGMEN